MFSIIETIGMQGLRLRKIGFEQQVSVQITDRNGKLQERIISIRAMNQADCEKLANRYSNRWQAQILSSKLQRTFGLVGKNKGKNGFLGFLKVHSYQRALGHAFKPLGIRHGKLLFGALAHFQSNNVVDNQSPSLDTLKKRLKFTIYHIAFNIGFLAMSIASAYVGYQHQGQQYLLINPHYIFAIFCGLIGLVSFLKNTRDRRKLKQMISGAGL